MIYIKRKVVFFFLFFIGKQTKRLSKRKNVQYSIRYNNNIIIIIITHVYFYICSHGRAYNYNTIYIVHIFFLQTVVVVYDLCVIVKLDGGTVLFRFIIIILFIFLLG